jgi:RNA polymerase sigma-70 factor (ECF subfamily)
VNATGTLVEVLRSEGVRVLATLARTIGDLAVAEDALSEATMAKRLVRARSKIATARIPYAIPSDAELPGRLAAR